MGGPETPFGGKCAAVAIAMGIILFLPTSPPERVVQGGNASGGGNILSPPSLAERYAALVNYSDVLLIRNLNSATSMTIADYFRSQRNISWSHVCNVTTSTNEEIDAATFTALASQVKTCISALPPATINFLVTTKGVPLKTWRSPWTSASSVDSELAIVGGPYEGQTGLSNWLINPYYNDFVPFTNSRYHFYIVTRLEAFTLKETFGLVDKATEAIGRRGRFVLDVDPGKDGGGYQIGNDWMRDAAPILTARGFDVTLDETYTFLTNYSKVMGYSSWGSNDGAWYAAMNANSGFETDADSNGVPDGWFYDDPARTANVSMNSSVKESGSWSMNVTRPVVDGNYTAISENFTPVAGSRYYLSGSVNLTYGVAGRGLFLQIEAFDSSDRLLAVQNGSASAGNSKWIGLSQVIYEPIPNATKLRVSVVFAQANGTAYVDNIRLIEVRPHNHWIPGSLAETAVSTGGRTFTYGNGYGQSLVADLIRDGVTGVKGYVYEPFLNAIAHSDILFDAYTRGYTLGESYMMASQWGLSWMDTIIGEPKLAPYNMSYVQDLAVFPDDITFSNPRPQPGDVIDFNANIRNLGHFPAMNSTVSFYLGDPAAGGALLGNRTVSVLDNSTATASIQFDTTGLNGWYDLCVFADSPNDFYESNENNNVACNRIGVTTTYTLHLEPGHRFISFPLLPANSSIESVLSSIAGCYDYVRYYAAIDAVSPWKSYVPGRSYNSLRYLDNEMGFWINVTAPCDLIVIGVKPDGRMLDLYPGWNMIGFPSFNTTYTVADFNAALGLSGVIVEVFDAGAAPYYLGRASGSTIMQTGEGLWVYVPSSVSWVPPR